MAEGENGDENVVYLSSHSCRAESKDEAGRLDADIKAKMTRETIRGVIGVGE